MFDLNDPNKKTYICYFCLLVILFIVGYYFTKDMKTPEDKVKEHFSMYLDDSIDKYLYDMAPCSKSCCGQYWPIPFMQNCNDSICKLVANGTYIPSNYSCANRDTSGCVCQTKQMFNYLAMRGKNITLDNYGDLLK